MAALITGYYVEKDYIKQLATLKEDVSKKREDSFCWYHLNVLKEETKRWLKEESGLSDIVIKELISEETRPRILKDEAGILLNLRGLNLNPDSDEEDMVSLHMWIEPGRIITTRSERIFTIDDINQSYQKGKGPRTTADFLIQVIDGISNRISDYIYDIEEQIDEMEEEVLTAERSKLRSLISEKRREAVIIRRYIVPQRESMARLYREKIAWLDEDDKEYIYEFSNRSIRQIEELDTIRDRAALVQEELNNKINDQMNRTMYILSIVGSIFLPLGFLTGLFGINIGGMPGTESNLSFAIFSIIMILIIGIEYWLFKRNDWI
ncbi:zinc transporter [Halanaerobium saccharolyticum]|uniref:Zinc transporter n=1 Tax=Halanaerobium saccharolyticum TaxID=43595 RepID=A0A4R6LPP0_9FIRM|nr:CorA family divalent cation transporter [Halanaerobium saccharolyticum]TDO89292.1 zinc transporter [Halanaerobium saccharolyticum]